MKEYESSMDTKTILYQLSNFKRANMYILMDPMFEKKKNLSLQLLLVPKRYLENEL